MAVLSFRSISGKTILLAVGIVLTTAVITDRVYFFNTQKLLIDGEIKVVEEEARLLLAPIRRAINGMKIDIRTLYADPALLAIIEADSAPKFAPLAKIFRQQLLTQPLYDGISFIAASGLEQLRLERKGQVVSRVADTSHQNFATEPYFLEAIAQAPGTVYFSDIEPKRINGLLVKPLAVTLRATLPMYRNDSRVAGALVLSLNLSQLIKSLQDDVNAKRQLFVTNTYGEYLAHPERGKLMGISTEKYTIQDEFPKSSQVVEGDKRKLLAQTEDGKILSYLSLPFDPLNPDRLIGIGLTADRQVLLQDVYQLQRNNILIVSVLATVVALIAAVFGRMIALPVARISNLAQTFPEQSNTADLPTTRKDEIGTLAKSLARLVNEVNDQEWLRNGQLRLAEAARTDSTLEAARTDSTLEGCAYHMLKATCCYINAPLGALYHLDEQRNFQLIASFACKGRAKARENIQAGDSVFSAALEEGVIQIDHDLPENYFRIHSGLGETRPRHRLVMPIAIERSTVAVIEIASLAPFSSRDSVLLERCSEAIGLAILAAASRDELKGLFEESKTQQEELKASNEELETQSAKLELQQSELEQQASELASQNNQLLEQKRKIEEQTLALQKKMEEVEKVNGYKSEFLATMSHELRTPLNSLLILAKAFQQNEEGNLTQEQVEEAAVIYNGGVELLNLINDVLDFSKIEAGKVTVVKGDVPVETLVQKLIRQFSPLAKQHGIALQSEIDPDVPETFYSDAQRLEQILINLLSNAIKFTAEGHVKLSVTKEGSERINFAVSDTGVGIDAQNHRAIFEAFRQEDGSIERQYGGTGLGLSISQQLAKLLDGHISLTSEKGKGSVFCVTLPVNTHAHRTLPSVVNEPSQDALVTTLSQSLPKIHSPTHKGKPQLLIIEDDVTFAKTLQKVANKTGFDTLIANTGKDALILIQARKPQAIVLDLMLPDIDGLYILQQLKSDLKTRHIPVHVVSASEDKSRFTFSCGAAGFIRKPLTNDDINAMFASVANMNQSAVKHVLVVEDDTNTQVAIKKLLQNKQLVISCVSTAQAGIDALQSKNFDCVILDLQLPDMTGFDWLKKVETLNVDKIPPVVVYTARKLNREEIQRLEEYTGSIVIKGAHSPERLLDEVMLFLHSVESSLNDEQQRIISMQHDPNQHLKEGKILLVDDDMRNVFAISKMLKKQGLDVVVADNGELALENLKKHGDISLVVMDIMMPVMDGYEAIRNIRKQEKYSKLPIIALTARTMPEEREKCLHAGANDYLAKPVDIDVLLTLMRVLLFRPLDKIA